MPATVMQETSKPPLLYERQETQFGEDDGSEQTGLLPRSPIHPSVETADWEEKDIISSSASVILTRIDGQLRTTNTDTDAETTQDAKRVRDAKRARATPALSPETREDSRERQERSSSVNLSKRAPLDLGIQPVLATYNLRSSSFVSANIKKIKGRRPAFQGERRKRM